MKTRRSRNIVIVVIAAIVAAVLLGVGIFFIIRGSKSNHDTPGEEVVEQSDTEKFKQSYESLNGTIRESDGATYNTVEISSDNPIVYVDAKQALDLLKSDKAIIYIGANWCPHCRNSVPVLLDVAKQYDLGKVYYLELDDIKSQYEWRDGQAVKTQDGTEEYYALLGVLAERLNDYIIKDDAGNDQPTGEKRIYMPYVLAIKDGQVVGGFVGDVATEDYEEGQTKYDPLTTAQYEKLFNNYENLLRAVYGDTAGDDCEEVCD